MGGTASHNGFRVVGRLERNVGNVGRGETVLRVGKGGSDDGNVGSVGNVGKEVVGRGSVGENMGAKVVVIVGITVVVTVGIGVVVIVGAKVNVELTIVVAGKVRPGDTVM